MKEAILVDSDKFQDYDFGPQHPLTPKRLILAHKLIEELGMFEDPKVGLEEARYATDEEVGLIHGDTYIKLLKKASEPLAPSAMWEIGLGPGDNPIFEGMYDSSRLYVGASLLAADLIMKGKTKRAFNISGGLHHALGSKALNAKGETVDTGRDDRASGFCILNDCAIAAAYLIKNYGVKKIMYIDVDAHHGDGMQWIFYNLDNVLTCSIHQDGRSLFPGTGFIGEIGQDKGKGYSVNIPVLPYTFEEPYLKALKEIVIPIAKKYKPEIIISQLGVDTHFSDPLTNLLLTTGTYQKIAKILYDLTNEVCDGKWLALGGGGYSPDIVGKSWTIYFAQMANFKIPEEVPESWRTLSKEMIGKSPTRFFIDKENPLVRLSDNDQELVKSKMDDIISKIKQVIFPILEI
ncbi:MAG: acetoin utilization protein AcuC [Candidatus Helarchaeota archaeon]